MDNVAHQWAMASGGDVEDLKSNLMLLWFEKFDRLEPYLAIEDAEVTTRILARTFQRWCSKYTKVEAKQSGRDPRSEDAYYYSRKMIQLMLPYVEDPRAWSSLAAAGEQHEVKAKQPANTAGNLLAHFADLTAAWDRLTPEERQLLRLRYVHNTPYVELAEELGHDEPMLRKRVERALSRMQKFMGSQVRKGELPRKAMSNAQAQVMTRRNFNGD